MLLHHLYQLPCQICCIMFIVILLYDKTALQQLVVRGDEVSSNCNEVLVGHTSPVVSGYVQLCNSVQFQYYLLFNVIHYFGYQLVHQGFA